VQIHLKARDAREVCDKKGRVVEAARKEQRSVQGRRDPRGREVEENLWEGCLFIPVVGDGPRAQVKSLRRRRPDGGNPCEKVGVRAYLLYT